MSNGNQSFDEQIPVHLEKADHPEDDTDFVDNDDISNNNLDFDQELSRMHKTPEKTVDERFVISANDEHLTQRMPRLEGMKKFIDDLNIETEMLKTDVEEVKQLDDIKQLLAELSKQKEQLKSNVEEIKARFSTKPLVEKYDDIERKLQSAADNLYSIQSNIYERIKEIRIIRKDLSVIKEDLDSL